jgi:hypothetical protein
MLSVILADIFCVAESSEGIEAKHSEFGNTM